MATKHIIIDMDLEYHDATPALDRVIRMIEFAGEGYGIRNFSYEVVED